MLVACELGIFYLRRRKTALRPGLLYHAAALFLALWAGLELTPWATAETLIWQAVCGAALVLVALVLYSLFDVFVLRRPWDPQRGPMAPALVRDVGRILVAAAALLLALTWVHEGSLGTVLVSSTVLSAVLGLALQDVLKNVFAGMALQMEQSLRVGDWLSIDGQPAVVVELGWRATRLRTNEGVELVEPNSEVSSRRLTVYGSGRRPVGFGFRVGLPYATPPAEARAALLAAARSAEGAVESPPPQAMVRSYDDSAITYELRVFTREVAAIARFRDAVYSRVWYELQRAGIDVPFPVRTVELHDVARERGIEGERERSRRRALLGGLDLFADLPAETLDNLVAAAREQHFDHGERLVREGDTGDSLYVLEQGRVVVSTSGDGEATIAAGGGGGASGTLQLAVLGSGDFFGEMSLLTGAPRSATVRADGGCRVLVLTKSDLAPVLQADPDLAELLCRAVERRQAATAAARAERRERRPERTAQRDDAVSLLGRVREFFRLPGR